MLLAVIAMACGASGGSETALVGDDTTDGKTEVAVVDHDEGAGHEEAEAAVHEDEHDDDHDGVEAAVSDDGHDDDHDGVEAALSDDGHDDDHDAVDGDILEVTLKVVEGGHWGFDPNVFEVPVGQRVRLTLVNDGRAEHDVEIAGLLVEHLEFEGGTGHEESQGGGHHDTELVAAHAVAGTSASVLFTPTKVGEYNFACTLEGHKDAGMVGKIIVTPAL